MLFPTHFASTDSLAYASSLESLRYGSLELGVFINGGQPEAELVGKVVASPPGSVALNEGRGTEIL